MSPVKPNNIDELELTNVKLDDYPTITYELNENALNLIYNENYERAQLMLQRAVSFLQKVNAHTNTQNAGIILLTHHNLALCFQKLGMLEECGNHIEFCLKQVPNLIESKKTLENKLKTTKYLAKLHMQYCAVLSQQSRHQDAIEHAKYGTRYIHHSLKLLQEITENLLLATEFSLLESTSKKILPILRELRSRLVCEDKNSMRNLIKPERSALRLDIRNMFGFMPCAETVLGLNIGNIMQLSPLSIVDVLSEYDKQLELTRESLLEKVALLVVSYFCISTEKRFLSQELTGENAKTILKESEFYHAKALEIACCFLPTDCPLVAHVYMSYQKHHSVVRDVIVFLLLFAYIEQA